MIFKAGGVKVVQFGNGTVQIMPSIIKDDGEIYGTLSFGELDEPVPIGQDIPVDGIKNDVDLGAQVRMVFTKVESLDVVIEGLQKVRVMMLKREGEF